MNHVAHGPLVKFPVYNGIKGFLFSFQYTMESLYVWGSMLGNNQNFIGSFGHYFLDSKFCKWKNLLLIHKLTKDRINKPTGKLKKESYLFASRNQCSQFSLLGLSLKLLMVFDFVNFFFNPVIYQYTCIINIDELDLKQKLQANCFFMVRFNPIFWKQNSTNLFTLLLKKPAFSNSFP